MDETRYPLRFHFYELKNRIIYLLVFYAIFFTISYIYAEDICTKLLEPLNLKKSSSSSTMIYTGLTEAFLSYIKLSSYSAFILLFPALTYNIYRYLSPGLHNFEKKIARILFFLSPFLFTLGVIFVYCIVMPKAWDFFLGFEQKEKTMPIVFTGRISEYINLCINLMTAFGLAFQMPIALVILCMLNILKVETLIKNRRYSIVIIFIIAGVITPPDVLSQLLLAIPMLLLYEISIILCKLVKINYKDT